MSVSQEIIEPNAFTQENARPALNLHIGTYGRLNTLQWVPRPERQLGNNEVELDTKAVGLNFKDILVAMGVIDAVTVSFGLEAIGVVRQVGASVRPSLKIGDRVVVFSGNCFSTHVRIDSDLCV